MSIGSSRVPYSTSNFLSMYNINSGMQSSISRLQSGLRVNSPLDAPASFLTASSLSTQAADLNRILESTSLSFGALNTARTGLSTIEGILRSAQSLGQSALSATTTTPGTGTPGSPGTPLTLTGATEFRANVTTAGDQIDPTVTTLTNGNYVVTWTSSGQDGSGLGVYGRVFNSSGTAVSSEFLVNTATTGDQKTPSVAALANGGFVVAYESASKIYAQRFDSAGTKVGAEALVSNDPFTETSPKVVGLTGGGFAVAYDSLNQDQSGGLGTYVRRFDASGVAVGSKTLINQTVAGNQSLQALTALNDGGFAAVWNSPDGGSTKDVFYRRFDASGVAAGGEVRVNTTTGNDQQFGAVDVLNDGSFVVSWTSLQSGNTGIFAQRYSSTGTAIGGEFKVNSTNGLDAAARSAITSLSDGGFVVAWENDPVSAPPPSGGPLTLTPSSVVTATTTADSSTDFENNEIAITELTNGNTVVTWTNSGADGSGRGVFARIYNPSGVAQGAEIQINTRTSGDQKASKIVALSGGGFVAIYDERATSKAYGQIFDSSGNKVGSEFLIGQNTTAEYWEGTLTATSDGGFVATYTNFGFEGANRGLYARKFNSSGVGGTEFRVNQATADTQEAGRVTELSNGDLVFSYASYHSDTTYGDTYIRRFSASGTALGNEVLVNSSTTLGRQAYSDITALADGGFAVAWSSNDAGTTAQIRAKIYDRTYAGLNGIVGFLSCWMR